MMEIMKFDFMCSKVNLGSELSLSVSVCRQKLKVCGPLLDLTDPVAPTLVTSIESELCQS